MSDLLLCHKYLGGRGETPNIVMARAVQPDLKV